MISELTLFTTFALNHLFIGVALFVCLSCIMYIIKMTAEMQSWLWLTAFVAATIIPFSLFAPDINVGTAIVNKTVSEINLRQIIHIPTPQNVLPASVRDNVKTTKLSTMSQPEWHVPSHIIIKITPLLYLFFAIWICGSGWRAYIVANSYYRTRQLLGCARKSLRLDPLQRYSRAPVLISDLSATPLVAGLLNTVLILPSSFLDDLSEQQLKPIIFHELAHIQRKDLWFGFFQEIIAIVFWWSPVIRLLNRKIHISRELACDLRAAKKMSSSKHYAQSLLDCAKLMLVKKQNVLAMGMFSHKKDLEHRINTVLKTSSSTKNSLALILLVCCSLTFVCISTAQNFIPKVSLSAVEIQSKQYQPLPPKDSDRMINAVNRNDIEAVKRLVSEGIDIDKPLIGDGTALIIAIKGNNRDMVNALIEMGANVDQPSRGDGNPLIAAIATNNLSLADLLIANGANVNAKVRGDGTPLIVAVKHNNQELVKTLLASGADVNRSSRGDGNPLITAAGSNKLEMATLLLSHGADVNAVVAGDETALINAARKGYLEMTELLVEQGADVNLSVKTGWGDGFKVRTPLNTARNPKIKAYLIQQGAIE